MLQIPQQMQKANQSGGGNDDSIFWSINTDNVTDEGKGSEKLKDFNPQNPVKKYAIGEPVVFANGLEVTLNSVTDDQIWMFRMIKTVSIQGKNNID